MKKTSAFYLSGFSTWSTHAHGYLFLADLTSFQVRSFLNLVPPVLQNHVYDGSSWTNMFPDSFGLIIH